MQAPTEAPVRRRKSYLKANVAVTAAIALVAAAAWLTAMRLVEAHGLGATHLGQLADPLKRNGPTVMLIAFDVVAVVIAAALGRLARRSFRAGSVPPRQHDRADQQQPDLRHQVGGAHAGR